MKNVRFDVPSIRFVKLFAKITYSLVTKFYNKCVKYCVFSDSPKHIEVVQIYKSDKKMM